MLKMLLESRDHMVVDAPDGFAALQLLSGQPADIAFIDIGLPAMDGYEVAQRIRKQPHLAGVTLVALSGYGSPNDVAAALAAGFDHHLIKPAPLAKLEDILSKVEGGLGPARQRRTTRTTGPIPRLTRVAPAGSAHLRDASEAEPE